MSKINRNEIFDKNLNFLIGSGASYGLLPTLALNLKNSQTGKSASLEELATLYEDNKIIRTLLFSWYVKEVISPAANFDAALLVDETNEYKAFQNYERFLATILAMIGRKACQKKANIFTTNYDGLVAHAAETILTNSSADFALNDGGSGFIRRTLFAKNFNRFYRDQGVFDRHSTDVAQINLMQMHGSVYWYKRGEDIEISYSKDRAASRVNEVPLINCDQFDQLLANSTKNETDLEGFEFEVSDDDIVRFWDAYKQLPIVNPTKWKFHETVFEEHYYQMLRLLSYELEKPDTIFITFGFSFADEHVLNLVKRSLSNPTLQMFICCFNSYEQDQMIQKFSSFPNVEMISLENDLDFTAFNNEVFSVSHQTNEDTE